MGSGQFIDGESLYFSDLGQNPFYPVMDRLRRIAGRPVARVVAGNLGRED